MTTTPRAGHRPCVLMVEIGGRGGISDYTQALVAALTVQGHGVELVTARDHLYTLPPSVPVHALVPWVRDRAPVGRLVRRAGLGKVVNALAYVAVMPRIALLARRAEAVHVQSHQFPPLGALLAVTVRLAGRPLITTAHNTFDRGASYRRSHRIMRRASRTTIVHTSADEQRLRAEPGVRHVAVIPHGEYGGLARTGGDADPAVARAALGFSRDDFVALLFGQLRPDKGIGDLLVAAAEVPEVRVLLAGEDIGGLRQVRSELDAVADRVVLREGYMPMSAAARLFAAADVVVLPYRMASQSGVLLLAYGFGRPVIAYPVGGLVEAVEDGVTGWLAAEPTPAALARSLRAAAAAGREERVRRGEAGRELAEQRYSWTAIAAKTRALYADEGPPSGQGSESRSSYYRST